MLPLVRNYPSIASGATTSPTVYAPIDQDSGGIDVASSDYFTVTLYLTAPGYYQSATATYRLTAISLLDGIVSFDVQLL